MARPKVISDEWKKKTALAMVDWFEKQEYNILLKEYAHTIPSLTTGIPYSWNVLYNVCKDNETFMQAWEICKEIQEARTYRLSLVRSSSGGAIFALKNNHGWTDRPEENEADDGENVELVLIPD
jgi:hypothetical protein